MKFRDGVQGKWISFLFLCESQEDSLILLIGLYFKVGVWVFEPDVEQKPR